MARLVPATAVAAPRKSGGTAVRLAHLGGRAPRPGVGVTLESVVKACGREHTSVLWSIRNDGVINASAPLEFRAPTGVLHLRARVRRTPAAGADPIVTVHNLAAPAPGADGRGACVIAIPYAPWARAPSWRFCRAEMHSDGQVAALHDLLRANAPCAGCVLLALSSVIAANPETTQRS